MDEETRAIVPLEGTVPSETDAAQELAVPAPAELAAEVSKAMDLIAERLKLETPHPSTASRVRGARTVPRDFVVSMIDVAERRPDLRFLGEFNSGEAREVLQAIEAYRLLSERTAMFLARLNYTIEARWASIVAEATQKFALASILAEDKREPELAAEVETLRKHLGRKGPGKKKGAKKSGKRSA